MLGLMLAMSATAYAGEVYVGDTNVSNGGEFCNGAVKYDANTKTLTLKNYTYEGSGMGYCGINVDWNTKFTVVLEGVNTVKCTAEDGDGINNTGWLVFKGNGTLNISGQDNGIKSESGKVVIESGTVNATSTGTDDSSHAGIRCNMEFEMSGGTVNAKANCPDNGYTNVGIWTDRTSNISGGN